MTRWMLLLPWFVACDFAGGAGTQIGVETGEQCEEVSREVVSDPAVAAEGFAITPADALAAWGGTFTGAVLDDLEEPTDEVMTLEVGASTGDITLVRLEPVQTDREIDLGVLCSDYYTVDAPVTLTAPGVDWSASLAIELREDGSLMARGALGADEATAPTPSFDADAMDRVDLRLFLSSNGGDGAPWWAELSWTGEREDGQGEDGTASITQELVVMGRVDPAE